MSITIYELTSELMALYEMASDPDVDMECLADTMEAVEGEFELKADGYAKVMKQLEHDALVLKAEEERLAKRRKAKENALKNIKKRLEMAMIATGKTKFKTDLFSFGIQKNPAKLVLAEDVDVNSLDPEWLIFNDPIVDKDAVKTALKNGEEFEWAKLVQEESLRIR